MQGESTPESSCSWAKQAKNPKWYSVGYIGLGLLQRPGIFDEEVMQDLVSMVNRGVMYNRMTFDRQTAWKSARTAANYDRQRFSSLGGRFHDLAEKRAIGKLLEVAGRERPIDRVLDIPCGTGRISRWLLDAGCRVECADVSDAMIDVAMQRIGDASGLIGFDLLDVFQIARPPDSYDCVTCIRLFQHFRSEERIAALRELGRVSKRFVLINVMYSAGYYAVLRKIRQNFGRYAPRYTLDDDQLAMESAAASLRLVASRFAQPGYSGNLVILLEKG